MQDYQNEICQILEKFIENNENNENNENKTDWVIVKFDGLYWDIPTRFKSHIISQTNLLETHKVYMANIAGYAISYTIDTKLFIKAELIIPNKSMTAFSTLRHNNIIALDIIEPSVKFKLNSKRPMTFDRIIKKLISPYQDFLSNIKTYN